MVRNASSRPEEVAIVVGTHPGITPRHVAEELGISTRAASNAISQAIRKGFIIGRGNSSARRLWPRLKDASDPLTHNPRHALEGPLQAWLDDLSPNTRRALSRGDLQLMPGHQDRVQEARVRAELWVGTLSETARDSLSGHDIAALVAALLK